MGVTVSVSSTRSEIPENPVRLQEAIEICKEKFASFSEWPPQQGQVISCMVAVFDAIKERGIA